MAEAINVFVSYSWDVERKTGIVDELEKLCQYRNIRLLRDNNVIKHGELIQQFMDKLTGGEHVITVFSKPYFQSPWCMYELLKTWQKGDFQQRTHPIIADDCDLQDVAYRIGVVDYWVAEHQKLEALLQGRNPALFVEEHENANMLRDISQNANKLMNFAKGRLTTPLADLKANGYAQILDQIAKAQPHADGQNSDQAYMQEIRKSLESELKKSDPFRERIIQACDIDLADVPHVGEYLIEQCLAGEFVAIIDYLQSALRECLDEMDEGDVAAVRKVSQAAEGVVSKLVLFNIRNGWMTQYQSACRNRSHHDHVLPDMSVAAATTVASRGACTLPKFHLDRNTLTLQGGRGVALEIGFRMKGDRNVVREILKKIYAKVMEREASGDVDEKSLGILRETIRQHKQKTNLKLKKDYFLLIPDDNSSALSSKEVQDELKKLLPELAFFRLQSGNKEDAFIVADVELAVALRDFFKTLEGL